MRHKEAAPCVSLGVLIMMMTSAMATTKMRTTIMIIKIISMIHKKSTSENLIMHTGKEKNYNFVKSNSPIEKKHLEADVNKNSNHKKKKSGFF